MQTTTPPFRKLAAPLAFAGLCIVLSIATWIAFGGSVPFQPAKYKLSVRLPDATSLYPGSQVQIAGVRVGKVTAVKLGAKGRGGVTATLQLDNQYVPLHAGASATLRTKTLLGEGFIELAPGPQSAPALRDGGSLATSQVVPQQRLTDILQTFAPATRARIRQLFTGLDRAFHGRSQALNDSLGAAAPTTESVTGVFGTLNGERPALRSLIADAGTALEALGEREGALRTAVTAGNEVLDTTATDRAGLGATLDALPPFLGSLRRASNVLGTLSVSLTPAVRSLEPVVPLIGPSLRAIDAAAPTFRSLFAALPAVLEAGDRDLPSLTSILRAAPVAFAQVYTAVRQLIPIAQLASVSSPSLVASLANVGSIANGRFELGNGTATPTVPGVPTIWNEALAGWLKRLPTNRMNAYPTTADLIAQKTTHVLKAFDCRNLGNPAYLPPFGTGTPPCLVQGAYAFDGRTAEYPRLYLAPK